MSSVESAQSGDTREAATATGGRTPYMAIYVLLAAAFIAILNETVMSVAIPVI